MATIDPDVARSTSVLVVDDEEISAGFLVSLLSGHGFSAEAAGSGAEALERLGRGRIGLVVADRGLPDMSCLDFLRAARRLVPDSRVVVLATSGTARSAIEAFQAGAADYVVRGGEALDVFVERLCAAAAAPAPDPAALEDLAVETLAAGELDEVLAALREGVLGVVVR